MALYLFNTVQYLDLGLNAGGAGWYFVPAGIDPEEYDFSGDETDTILAYNADRTNHINAFIVVDGSDAFDGVGTGLSGDNPEINAPSDIDAFDSDGSFSNRPQVPRYLITSSLDHDITFGDLADDLVNDADYKKPLIVFEHDLESMVFTTIEADVAGRSVKFVRGTFIFTNDEGNRITVTVEDSAYDYDFDIADGDFAGPDHTDDEDDYAPVSISALDFAKIAPVSNIAPFTIFEIAENTDGSTTPVVITTFQATAAVGQTITLGAGAQTVVYRFESDSDPRNWSFTDGSDTVNNFKVGEDSLLLIDQNLYGENSLNALLDSISKILPGNTVKLVFTKDGAGYSEVALQVAGSGQGIKFIFDEAIEGTLASDITTEITAKGSTTDSSLDITDAQTIIEKIFTTSGSDDNGDLIDVTSDITPSGIDIV